jgi:hypothetical protein
LSGGGTAGAADFAFGTGGCGSPAFSTI